jgi:hypothetical protein
MVGDMSAGRAEGSESAGMQNVDEPTTPSADEQATIFWVDPVVMVQLLRAEATYHS